MRYLLALLCLASMEVGAACSGSSPNFTSTPDSTSLQSCFNSASTSGDQVTISAGASNWTTQVTWTAPANAVLKTSSNANCPSSCDDGVAITDNYASNSPILDITTNATGTFRMTGITFKGGTGSQKYNGIVKIAGFSKSLRIDHIHIDGTTSTNVPSGLMDMYGYVNGVVDHSVFDLQSVGNGVRTWMDAYGGSGSFGDAAWNASTALGTSDFIFIEDNVFNSTTQLGFTNDCKYGGKFVFRHNTVNKAAVQMHSTASSPRGRGCRAWEIYDNTFNGDGSPSPVDTATYIDSGTGIIFRNNVQTNGYKNFSTVHENRKDNTTYTQSATPAGWGYCGTAFNGTGSNWDQNSPSAVTGYACLDQIGRGSGDLILGDHPNALNQRTSSIAWPVQNLEPVYEWLNTWSCGSCGGSYWSVYEPTVITANQDYYLYTGSFNGSSGVGSGTHASRPATCTPLVSYWETDTNKLFQCTSTNTWTQYYAPYTYPHPLVGGGLLPAPTNLRARPVWWEMIPYFLHHFARTE
jgi:polyisoprenoid-binding protein YceI